MLVNFDYKDNLPAYITEKINQKRKSRKTTQKSDLLNKTRLNLTTAELKIIFNNNKINGISNYLNNLTVTEVTKYSL